MFSFIISFGWKMTALVLTAGGALLGNAIVNIGNIGPSNSNTKVSYIKLF